MLVISMLEAVNRSPYLVVKTGIVHALQGRSNVQPTGIGTYLSPLLLLLRIYLVISQYSYNFESVTTAYLLDPSSSSELPCHEPSTCVMLAGEAEPQSNPKDVPSQLLQSIIGFLV